MTARTSLLLLPLATACSPEAVDLVSVEVSDPRLVTIDTSCADDCIDELTLQVTFEEHVAVDPTAEVRLQSYTLTYDLAAEGLQPSPFTAPLNLRVSSGGVGYAQFLPAGPDQQAEVAAAVGGDMVSGTAELRLDGVDWRDEPLSISTELALAFQDLAEG